ncbi:MAG TPA: HAMP domain-containing sensor histidine kinase [Roseiflexaceae bacterium]|nr:HAMP domain-containing sensor histidine kinase [Roseiflexaceae bacterium]
MVTVTLTVAFSAAFLLTAQVYQISGLRPAPLVQQVLNSLVGLLLLGVVGATLSRVFRSSAWAQQMNMFAPLLKAMEQIARGDFSVQVEQPSNFNTDDPITKLFKGVNDMALELKQMEAMRQEFISNVSHEIQSPLTSIRGFAQALRDGALGAEERAHYLNIIETESTRLSKLSDNLLALAALEAENRIFEPTRYRLDKQIRDLILACEPQWAGKAIEMDVSFEEVTITADHDMLSQVWINLISNSIKFTPEGGRICVDLYQADDGIAFGITDNGIGISEADQAHIFERFYKADKSRTRANGGGSGLGLSIAQKIVEMHRGTIAVESNVGEGTTFIVSLPSGGAPTD